MSRNNQTVLAIWEQNPVFLKHHKHRLSIAKICIKMLNLQLVMYSVCPSVPYTWSAKWQNNKQNNKQMPQFSLSLSDDAIYVITFYIELTRRDDLSWYRGDHIVWDDGWFSHKNKVNNVTVIYHINKSWQQERPNQISKKNETSLPKTMVAKSAIAKPNCTKTVGHTVQ